MQEGWSCSMRRLRQRYVIHQTSGNAKVHFTCVPYLKYGGEFGVCSNMERLTALLS